MAWTEVGNIRGPKGDKGDTEIPDVTGLARLVADTKFREAEDNPDDASVYAKLATFTITDSNSGLGGIYLASVSGSGDASSAIVTIHARSNGFGEPSECDVKLMGLTGSAIKSFDIEGYGTPNAKGETTKFHLWAVFQKGAAGKVSLYEISRSTVNRPAVEDTFFTDAAWKPSFDWVDSLSYPDYEASGYRPIVQDDHIVTQYARETVGNKFLNNCNAGGAKSNIIRYRASNLVPATPTTQGNQGEIATTDTFIYVCIAGNTWRRSPLTTW